MTRYRPLTSIILGLTGMLPAIAFLVTALARLIIGTKTPYYSIAPSFLQTPFDLFAFHKAQFILIGLMIAAALNAKSRTMLNTAIAYQSTSLLLLLTAYTFIQHLRY